MCQFYNFKRTLPLLDSPKADNGMQICVKVIYEEEFLAKTSR